MIKLLLGWEFGFGNGHAVVLREVSRYFPTEDFEFRFALRFTQAGGAAGLDPQCVVQAPGQPSFPIFPKSIPRSTYGEFVCEAFFGEGRDMARRLAGWDRIVTDFKPHAIVAEYAPGLSLFARGRVPVVVTGTGYTLPPPGMLEFPRLTENPTQQYAPEDVLLEKLNGYLLNAGSPPIERLPQINAADAHGLRTLPLFDPYSEHRRDGYLGVFHPGGSPMPKDEAAGLLAYFDETWQLHDGFLDGLLGAGIGGKAYLGPPLRRAARRLAQSGIELADGLFDLAREMPGKAVAIHMGTLGFASAAAFAGVPQVVITHHQENALIAQALSAAGVALRLRQSELTASRLSELIKCAATDPAMRARARSLADKLTLYRNHNPARDVAAMTRKLIN